MVSTLVSAEALTNKEFMSYPQEARKWWYSGVYTMLGHVAAIDYGSDQAQCVWNWFYDQPDARTVQLEETFNQYPDQSPTTVVLYYLRKSCNVFYKPSQE